MLSFLSHLPAFILSLRASEGSTAPPSLSNQKNVRDGRRNLLARLPPMAEGKDHAEAGRAGY
jgi:hypothetical protein